MRILSAFAASALAAVALATGLPGAAFAETSTPAPTAAATPSATPDDAVTVELAPANEGIISVGSDLETTITVHNGTDGAVAPGVVQLYLDRASFSTRSDLEAWFARSDTETNDVLGSFLTSVDVPAIPAGGTASPIAIDVPSETLALGGNDWGAKAFGARFSVDGTALSETHSSVVYYPSDSFQPTKLGIAVPITVPESTSGLISSDALAAYTSPNGILTQELAAVRGKDVALGIDPMILASIRILGNVAPPSAIVWLKRLQTAPNESFALQYADSDISVLRQAGSVTLPQPIDFTEQIAAQAKAQPDSYVADNGTGQKTATPTPGPTSDRTPTATPSGIPPTSSIPTTASLLAFPYTEQGMAWPLEGTVSSGDLPSLASSGVKTTILSSDNVKVASATTEDAKTKIGNQAAVVSDDTLSGLLQDAASAPTQDEWKADMAQLSAELATLTHERPSDARTLFATMERGWATTGSRFGETLTALTNLPWLRAVPLHDVLAGTSTTATLVSKKAPDARVDALTPLVKSDASLQAFATALKQPQLVTSKERLKMLALSSTAWSDNPAGLTAEIAKVTAANTKTIAGIKVVEGSSINVLGDRSSLPIYIQNNTPSVAVVYLRVVPSNYYLNIEKNDLPVTIQPKSQQRVTVPVQSVANGKVMITLTLSSVQGVAISTPSQVAINVQAGWETAITLVIAVAVVLLFGGGIYRSVRRRQRAKASKLTPEPTVGVSPGSEKGGAS